jgi:hypothetical protein
MNTVRKNRLDGHPCLDPLRGLRVERRPDPPISLFMKKPRSERRFQGAGDLL